MRAKAEPRLWTPSASSSELERLTERNGWSQATRTTAINVLSGFFTWAEKHGHAVRNPARLVPRLHATSLHNERRFVPSKQELRDLVKALDVHPHLRDLVIFATKTGLRLRNITALRPSDVHADHEGTFFVEMVTKNGEEHRVYLVGETLDLVKRKIRAGGEWLFPGPEGGRIRAHLINRNLPSAVERAGMPYGRGKYEFTFHSLRRAFATYLLNAGASINDVMSAGNWKDVRTVQRYAYLNSANRKASFALIDKELSFS